MNMREATIMTNSSEEHNLNLSPDSVNLLQGRVPTASALKKTRDESSPAAIISMRKIRQIFRHSHERYEKNIKAEY